MVKIKPSSQSQFGVSLHSSQFVSRKMKSKVQVANLKKASCQPKKKHPRDLQFCEFVTFVFGMVKSGCDRDLQR